MTSWTWLTWPDPIIDFGRELYVPWQITEGQQLYVDVAYFNGPLSPHINALGFALFGTSLRTLVVMNLVVVAVVLALLYRLGGLIGGRLAATLGCLSFVGIFGFGQYVRTGNFNWVCPYSHEMTHGSALSLAAIYFLWRFSDARRTRWLWACGLAVGLVALTKVEISAAVTAAVAIGLLAFLWADRMPLRRAARFMAIWFATALIPPLIAWLLLSLSMPPSQAAVATIGSWAYVFDSANSIDDQFLRAGMGLDEPWGNALKALQGAGIYLAVLMPFALVALVCRPTLRARHWLVAAAGLIAAAAFIWGAIPTNFVSDLGRPLPLFLVAIAVLATVQLIRRRHRAEPSEHLAPRLALILFALFMLLKMVLNVRLYHYGFALAMPATVVLVMVLASWPTQWIRARGGYAPIYAIALLMVLVGVTAAHLKRTAWHLEKKDHTVGSGADAFRADARGRVVDQAVDYIQDHSSRSDTLAIFPEGIMLNYLARRRAPTPYINLIPHEWRLYGPQRVEAAFRANPAQLIGLAQRNLSEYGPQTFGRDYAQGLFDWIRSDYRRAAGFAEQAGRFKIGLRRRKADDGAAAKQPID